MNLKLNEISIKKLEFFSEFVGVTPETLIKPIMEEALEMLNMHTCHTCEYKFVQVDYLYPECPNCGENDSEQIESIIDLNEPT